MVLGGAEMLLRKWNYQKREYEPYEVPDDWKVSLWESDMDTVVNCPHCGRQLTFGECYTSREIHNKFGMGFGVCGDCYEQEWERDRQYR